MFPSGDRRRVRPSVRSIAVSAVVLAGSLTLASQVFQYYVYAPLLAAIGISLSVTWFRFRSLRSMMPEPYGGGKRSSIDAKKAARSGILIVLGGILTLVVVMGSVFVLPPVAFFALIFGIMAGLPLEELLFFGLVTRLEKKSETRIFSVTEETGEEESTVLVKTVEMIPRLSWNSPRPTDN